MKDRLWDRSIRRISFGGTSNGGPRTDIPDNKNQFFDQFHWVYCGDRDTPRVLFIAKHEADELDDTVWYLGSSDGGAATAPDGMMVLGFGRGKGTKPLFKGVGHTFVIGFLNIRDLLVDENLHAGLKNARCAS